MNVALMATLGYTLLTMLLSKYRQTSSPAFTLVELLIVIVVIAILATISIVAYNGIQDRARAAAVSSALTQVAQKIAIWQVDNPGLSPTSLNDIGVANTDSLSYQYTQLDNGTNYCVTATQNKTSYFLNSTNQTTPTKGGCPGHGQGGVQAITNQFTNPQFEGPSVPVVQTGVSGVGIATYAGSKMAQATATTSAAVSMRLQQNENRWNIAANTPVYASLKICNGASSARSLSATIRFYDSTGSSLGNQLATVGSGNKQLQAGSCDDFTISGTSPSGTLSAGVNVNRDSGTGSVSGDVYYADNVMLTSQAASFADGSSPNWVWNGTPNDSTSTGPTQ